MFVKSLRARKILATNAKPTIEVELRTEKGTVRAQVPMGTSTGSREVAYLPVDAALNKFAIISRTFRVQHFYNQAEVDAALRLLDKTPKFREIGGNVALGISSAFFKAFAMEAGLEPFEYAYLVMRREDQKKKTLQEANMPAEKIEESIDVKLCMPMPLCNMVGGWAGQSDFQEFLMLPVHQKSFQSSIVSMAEAYHVIGERLRKDDVTFAYGKNLESAWVTELGLEKVLVIMSEVSSSMLFKVGIDVAASNIWDGRSYVYPSTGEKLLRTQQIELMDDLVKRYPVAYIEDPFEENDMVLHGTLTHRMHEKGVLVCGDDLYTTDPQVLQIGIANKATNCALVKPNQIGTISDTIEFVRAAKQAGMKTVMSHRSGETEDTLICHLAVGLGCDYVKIGIAGERTVKINELLRIEERIADSKSF
jgi:enolase